MCVFSLPPGSGPCVWPTLGCKGAAVLPPSHPSEDSHPPLLTRGVLHCSHEPGRRNGPGLQPQAWPEGREETGTRALGPGGQGLPGVRSTHCRSPCQSARPHQPGTVPLSSSTQARVQSGDHAAHFTLSPISPQGRRVLLILKCAEQTRVKCRARGQQIMNSKARVSD